MPVIGFLSAGTPTEASGEFRFRKGGGGMRGRLALGITVLAIASLTTASPSNAEFRVCNKSSKSLDVAFGYDGGRQGWISEGWWVIGVGKCVIVRGGDLNNRYYYVFAKGDNGTEWNADDDGQEGSAFCIADKVFTLYQRRYEPNDEEACKKQGLQSKNFLQVDVGEYLRWTQTLEDEASAKPAAPPPSAAPATPLPPSSGGNACQRYPNLC
jgi:uncharacterized membrane protein